MAELREYMMSDEDYQIMLRAQKRPPSKPMMVAGQLIPDDKGQLTINGTWQMLGLKLGFNWQTVRPHPRKGEKFFLAEPMEVKGRG